jgi:hypothetical protein
VSKTNNLIGERFSRLVVVRSAGVNKHKHALLECVCDCGKNTTVLANNLTRGRTGSCGCLQRDKAKTHGLVHKSNYKRWRGMLDRYYNPNDSKFKNYGGRGISVCSRWHDIAFFNEDMGDPPNEYSIDRINNDGNYEPGNCRWATREEQARNTSATVLLEYKGATKPLAEWADKLGLNYGMVWQRIKRGGWPVARAFEQPHRLSQN